jgi:hypothetical protein
MNKTVTIEFPFKNLSERKLMETTRLVPPGTYLNETTSKPQTKCLKAGDMEQMFDAVASDLPEFTHPYITAMINGPGVGDEPPAAYIETGITMNNRPDSCGVALDVHTLGKFIEHLQLLQAHLAKNI